MLAEHCKRLVAPYAGAWIEISFPLPGTDPQTVAPYAGAWIEIKYIVSCGAPLRSLPTRERGLKWYGEGL